LTASQIVKYRKLVDIVTRRHLNEAIRQYKDAASEIEAWALIVETVRWHNFSEVREMFKDADYVDGDVV
jgi:mRNA interferase HigB